MAELEAETHDLVEEARALNQNTLTKIDAYNRQARKLAWLTAVMLLLVLVVGGGGAVISQANNKILRESEYAFCSVGLSPPAVAGTPACRAAQARYAAQNARQAGTQIRPFAKVVCQEVVSALGGDPGRCSR